MSEKRRTNIFIAHTPLQNFVAAGIVGQFFSSTDYENVLFTSVSSSNKALFAKTFLIAKQSIIKGIWQTWKAKRNISNILKENSSNLFIPHTSAILDNFFFYSFPVAKYKVNINFYYEGILYFYPYREPFKLKSHLFRKLLGFLYGFNYRIEPEILPVNNLKVHCIYTILKRHTLGPKSKLREISLLNQTFEANVDHVLIMGGKPSLLSGSEVIMLYKRMISFILDSKREQKVFFKGHHADTSNYFELANNEIETINITQSGPIEEVIGQYAPKLVLSYPSSGLVNLKAIYGNKIDLRCFYIEEKKGHLKKLWPIFEELDIQITFV